MSTFLTLIIPMYNESENLKTGVLEEVHKFLKDQKFEYEVIISDDESSDDSREIVKEKIKKLPNFHLLANPHGGKPFAIRAATENAKGEICLFTDMDQSTPISEIEKILPYFDKGFDVVIGSRGLSREDFPWYRQVMSWGFRNFRRIFLLRSLVDTQCGFKAYRKEAGVKSFDKMTIFQNRGTGWRVGAWDVEFLFIADKLGYKVKEISVIWKDRDISLGKKKNFVKESKEMLREILRVSLNNWRGIYG